MATNAERIVCTWAHSVRLDVSTNRSFLVPGAGTSRAIFEWKSHVARRSEAPESKSEAGMASAARFGFWAATGTALSTLITFGIAIATPPLSGPLCRAGCFSYPYLDIEARFPRDYVWLFPAILATLFYLAFMVALHARMGPGGKLFGELGLALSVMAALTLVGDYFVQLAVVQPGVRNAEADGISLLSQYNPHGLFIALEELGYLLLSLSLVCVVPALSRATRLERAIRWLFLTGFVVNVLSLCWFLLRYGHQREYLFEITVISVDWLVLIVCGFLAAAVFRPARIGRCPRVTARAASNFPV